MCSNAHYSCGFTVKKSIFTWRQKQDLNSYLAEYNRSFGCDSWIKAERENSERPLLTPITHHEQKHTHAAARCFSPPNHHRLTVSRSFLPSARRRGATDQNWQTLHSSGLTLKSAADAHRVRELVCAVCSTPPTTILPVVNFVQVTWLTARGRCLTRHRCLNVTSLKKPQPTTRGSQISAFMKLKRSKYRQPTCPKKKSCFKSCRNTILSDFWLKGTLICVLNVIFIFFKVFWGAGWLWQ